MATEEEIGALKDLAILSTLYQENLLGKAYMLAWCAQRAARSSLIGRRATRVRRLLAASKRRKVVADGLGAFVGALVRHVHTLESGEYLS